MLQFGYGRERKSADVPVFVSYCTTLQKTLCPIRFEYLLFFLNFPNVVLESKIDKVTPGVRPTYLFKINRNIFIYTDCTMNSVKTCVITFYSTPVPSHSLLWFLLGLYFV
jgi:hypothetical protein